MMSIISKKRKNISFILKLIVIISAVVGIVMCTLAGRNSFMGGSRVFMYFTIQSNIAIAVICVICVIGGYLLMQDRAIGNKWQIELSLSEPSLLR